MSRGGAGLPERCPRERPSVLRDKKMSISDHTRCHCRACIAHHAVLRAPPERFPGLGKRLHSAAINIDDSDDNENAVSSSNHRRRTTPSSTTTTGYEQRVRLPVGGVPDNRQLDGADAAFTLSVVVVHRLMAGLGMLNSYRDTMPVILSHTLLKILEVWDFLAPPPMSERDAVPLLLIDANGMGQHYVLVTDVNANQRTLTVRDTVVENEHRRVRVKGFQDKLRGVGWTARWRFTGAQRDRTSCGWRVVSMLDEWRNGVREPQGQLPDAFMRRAMSVLVPFRDRISGATGRAVYDIRELTDERMENAIEMAASDDGLIVADQYWTGMVEALGV